MSKNLESLRYFLSSFENTFYKGNILVGKIILIIKNIEPVLFQFCVAKRPIFKSMSKILKDFGLLISITLRFLQVLDKESVP